MLDAVVGAHKSVVRVQTELDFQSQELTKESLETPGPTPLVTREEITDEKYTGGAVETGGAAGILATSPREFPEGGGLYTHKHESREYEHSRNVEQIHKPPGRLERLTVAVVIDEELGIPLAAQVTDLIKAAAGIDPERGDQVTVDTMKIDALKVAEEEAKLAETQQAAHARERTMRRALHYGSFLVLAAMVAAAMYMFRSRVAAVLELIPTIRATTEPTEQPGAAEVTMEMPPVAAGQPGGDEELISELSNIGASAPDVFAEQLQGWIGPPDTE